jgi:hypothetical protein
MVALKSATLPGVLSMTRVASPTVDVSVDPLAQIGVELDGAGKPVAKTLSSGGINGIKRSLSARGIIRSPSLPVAAEVQQTVSEAGGKSRTKTAASLLTRQALLGRATPPVALPTDPTLPTDTAVLSATLEASYVSKASLRINEHVNRIFPAAPLSAVSHGVPDVIYKGRIAPKPERAKELGILVVKCVATCHVRPLR